jgi:hypothetical protein
VLGDLPLCFAFLALLRVSFSGISILLSNEASVELLRHVLNVARDMPGVQESPQTHRLTAST